MYSALTFFGSGILICLSKNLEDENKTIQVSNEKKIWTKTLISGECKFTLPPKNKYHVSLISENNEVEYETDVIFNFGEYKEIEVSSLKI